MLPGSALKVPVWWWVVASYPLLSLTPTPVEVELGCDNLFIRKGNIYLYGPNYMTTLWYVWYMHAQEKYTIQ